MFVEANVLSVMVGNEIRHFLELSEAALEEISSRRLRIKRRKVDEVSGMGGMLLRSEKQLTALKDIGVSEVTIDTDKSDVVPDVEELREEQSRRQRSEPASSEGAGQEQVDGEYDDLTPESLETPADRAATTGPSGEGEREQAPVRSVDVGSTDRRRNFGPKNTGWMKVEILPAEGLAVLQVISFGGDDSLGEADVIAALESQYGIKGNTDGEMVGRLVKQAAASPSRVIRGHFPIVSGIEPDSASTGSVTYTCFEDVPGAETSLAFDDLRAALAADILTEVTAGPAAARMVMPGEELAVFLPPEGAPAGAAVEPLLRAGEYVQLIENHYVAAVLGYVCLEADEISVLPPVWVAPDRMAAHFIRYPQSGPDVMLTEDWILQAMEAVGVTNGVSEGGVQQALQESAPTDKGRSIIVAKASPSTPGEEGSVYFPFQRTRSGVAGAQHGADIAAQIEAAMVKNGDLLAEVTPAREPVAGKDVGGRELDDDTNAAVAKEPPLVVTAGTNVRMEERGARQYFHAESDGRVRSFNGVLRVHPVTYIDNNVNTAVTSGPGEDLHVRGSVRGSGAVTAEGCVVVDGIVEGGARLSVGEDVIVAKGMVGKQTLVNARGNVLCSMVQNATVSAGADLDLIGHSMNGRLRAGGKLTITGDEGERGGTAVGGELVSGNRIEARQITRGPSLTTLMIGPNPEIAARMQKVDVGLELCRTNMIRVFRTLGVQEVDATHFKELIERSPPEKRRPIMKLLGQLKRLVETRSQSLKNKQVLQQQQAAIYRGTQIHISGRVDSDVEIRIGEAKLTLENPMDGVVFGHQEDKIIVQGPEAPAPLR